VKWLKRCNKNIIEIVINDKWWNPGNINIMYQNKQHVITTSDTGGGFEYEIQHAAELILARKVDFQFIPNETSQKVASIMEHGLVENDFAHLVYPQI